MKQRIRIAGTLLCMAGLAQAEPVALQLVTNVSALAPDAIVHIGDHNGDNQPDVLILDPSQDRVLWVKKISNVFSSASVINTLPGLRTGVFADINGDGRVDLIAALDNGEIWLGMQHPSVIGSPQFSSFAVIATGQGLVDALAVGDLDANGRADILIASDAASPLRWLPQLSNPFSTQFASLRSITGPAEVSRITQLRLAYVDNDAVLDIVAAGGGVVGGNRNATVFWLPRANDGQFASAQILHQRLVGTAFQARITALAVGVTNGSAPDVVFSLEATKPGATVRELRLSRNDGSGVFDLPDMLAFDPPTGFTAITLEDLDRDGHADILAARGEVMLRIDSSPAGLGTPREIAMQEDTIVANTLHVLDADADGDPDVWIGTAEGGLRIMENRRIHGRVFLEDVIPQGSMGVSASNVVLFGPSDIAARPARRPFGQTQFLFTEFNGGRVNALVSAARITPSPLLLTLQTGDTPLLTNAGAARTIVLGDIDNDGQQDFLVGTGASGSAPPAGQDRLFFGRMTDAGVSLTASNCNAGDYRDVSLADTNRDGQIEFAYANEANDRIALNTQIHCVGERILSTPAGGIADGPNTSLYVDLNHDGHMDVLVAGRLPGGASTQGNFVGWYRALPPEPFADLHTYAPLARIGTLTAGGQAIAADVNGDGRLDVVASSGNPTTPAAGRVVMFRNLGDNAFGPPVALLDGIASPGRPAMADFDHDGDLDLIVSSDHLSSAAPPRSQCGVFFVEQGEAGVFAEPRCLDIGAEARRYTNTAIGDIDRDGTLDVAAVSQGSNRVALFGNTRPYQYLWRSQVLQPNVLIHGGDEQCVIGIELTHLGRPGDVVMQLDGLAIDLPGTQVHGHVQAMILRKDNGDGIPTPILDAQVGTALAPATGANWDIAIPPSGLGSQLGSQESTRFWVCLRIAPNASGPVVLMHAQITPSLRHFDEDVPLHGLVRGQLNEFRLRPLRVFGDSLEP